MRDSSIGLLQEQYVAGIQWRPDKAWRRESNTHLLKVSKETLQVQRVGCWALKK
jgi:hypothetical protein